MSTDESHGTYLQGRYQEGRYSHRSMGSHPEDTEDDYDFMQYRSGQEGIGPSQTRGMIVRGIPVHIMRGSDNSILQ